MSSFDCSSIVTPFLTADRCVWKVHWATGLADRGKGRGGGHFVLLLHRPVIPIRPKGVNYSAWKDQVSWSTLCTVSYVTIDTNYYYRISASTKWISEPWRNHLPVWFWSCKLAGVRVGGGGGLRGAGAKLEKKVTSEYIWCFLRINCSTVTQ